VIRVSIVASSPLVMEVSVWTRGEKFVVLVVQTLWGVWLSRGLIIDVAVDLARVSVAWWMAWESFKDVPTFDELVRLMSDLSVLVDYPFRGFDFSRQEVVDLMAVVLYWCLPYIGAVVRVEVEPEGIPLGVEWLVIGEAV